MPISTGSGTKISGATTPGGKKIRPVTDARITKRVKEIEKADPKAGEKAKAVLLGTLNALDPVFKALDAGREPIQKIAKDVFGIEPEPFENKPGLDIGGFGNAIYDIVTTPSSY